MKSRLHRIETTNFTAFREFRLDPERRHLLVYGANGSGKSSLYWAFCTFLQSARKPDGSISKYFDPDERQNLLTPTSKAMQTWTRPTTEQTGGEDHERNERIITELNREEPHTLDEDFTYKRPHGFILDGQATTGLTTWQRLYQLVCQQLFARDDQRFRSLIDHAEFISNRGHHTVTTDAGSLRKPLAVGGDLYMEANLSANSICDCAGY